MDRVLATPAARALLTDLRQRHGDIVLYQSHGCCDGSAPACFVRHELPLSADDRLLGHIDGTEFHASRAQCEYLQGLELTLDVAPGNAGNFSLEDGSGLHFTAALRLWTDDEFAQLPPLRPSLG